MNLRRKCELAFSGKLVGIVTSALRASFAADKYDPLLEQYSRFQNLHRHDDPRSEPWIVGQPLMWYQMSWRAPVQLQGPLLQCLRFCKHDWLIPWTKRQRSCCSLIISDCSPTTLLVFRPCHKVLFGRIWKTGLYAVRSYPLLCWGQRGKENAGYAWSQQIWTCLVLCQS